MKFSVNDLLQWVNPKAAPDKIAEQLTMAGLEVDAIHPVSADFAGVVVGEVLTCEKHPEADRLSVCEVNVGEASPVVIVCGASNIAADMKVPVAKVGAVLSKDFKITKAKLRGITSFGMICSEKELGLSDASAGIMPLPQDAPTGQDLRKYLQLDDVAIDIDLTPNRGDCASILGVAREVAVANHCSLKSVVNEAINPMTDSTITVKVNESGACPRYIARVIEGINPKAVTPIDIQESLRRAGIRPVSVIVDVTNYVMLQLGQPMHAFDYHKVKQGIVVRFAKEGETITLLDGKNISLQARTLVIADNDKPLAIAGIMGGEQAGISDDTADIILESAFFAPLHIAKRARMYNIQTDSSYRFERGVDPNITAEAMEMATRLIINIAGGACGPLVEKTSVDDLPKMRPIILRASRIKEILGLDLKSADVSRIFKALQFDIAINNKESWSVTPPSFRFDIEIEADLLEELARIYGYDKLQIQPVSPNISPVSAPKVVDLYKDILSHRGFYEAITYSFISPKMAEQFFDEAPMMELLNPISQELSVMRKSLLPGLLSAIHYNLSRSEKRVRLFEVGHCFEGVDKALVENTQLAAVVTGEQHQRHWQGGRSINFFDLKGDVQAMLASTYPQDQIGFVATAKPSYFHPGQCANICVNNKVVGHIGAIHPKHLQALGIKQTVYAFELKVLSPQEIKSKKYCALSKFPSISRDLALLLDETIEAENVCQCIKRSGGELLQHVSVFDIYEGEGVAKNKKSLALNLIFQDFSRTLKDEEISQLMQNILADLKTNLNAELRE